MRPALHAWLRTMERRFQPALCRLLSGSGRAKVVLCAAGAAWDRRVCAVVEVGAKPVETGAP